MLPRRSHPLRLLHLPTGLLTLALATLPAALPAQQQPASPPPAAAASPFKLIPHAMPVLPPEVMELLKLEDQFQQAVAKGGGAAFAAWFAPDGVTLNNGRPAVLGQPAIAARATWDPKAYQLQWYVEGAQMGPSGDTGFTWGHYDARSEDKDHHPVTTSGRYITFWKKVNGAWKVALDASAIDAPLTP
jgi:ketosteroid isomerase-like protein